MMAIIFAKPQWPEYVESCDKRRMVCVRLCGITNCNPEFSGFIPGEVYIYGIADCLL